MGTKKKNEKTLCKSNRWVFFSRSLNNFCTWSLSNHCSLSLSFSISWSSRSALHWQFSLLWQDGLDYYRIYPFGLFYCHHGCHMLLSFGAMFHPQKRSRRSLQKPMKVDKGPTPGIIWTALNTCRCYNDPWNLGSRRVSFRLPFSSLKSSFTVASPKDDYLYQSACYQCGSW